jgi:hypothetical protein
MRGLVCPVCSARFRGASQCGRCGADLTAVMTLAASAWRLRQAARLAIAAGDAARAGTLASQAEQICHTPAGSRLQALSAWLTETRQ